jgi:hypothetical protein
MDHPLCGEVSLGPEPFEAIYDTLLKPNKAVSKSMILIDKAETFGAPRLEDRVTLPCGRQDLKRGATEPVELAPAAP